MKLFFLLLLVLISCDSPAKVILTTFDDLSDDIIQEQVNHDKMAKE